MVSSDRNQISREVLAAALGDEWPPDLIQTAAELLSDSDSRFPSGPRRLPGDLVRAIQRTEFASRKPGSKCSVIVFKRRIIGYMQTIGTSQKTR